MARLPDAVQVRLTTDLERLHLAFTATPPPARSSVVQTAIAQIKFLDAWSLLGMADRALSAAGELQLPLLSPLQQLQVAEKVMGAHIDAGNVEAATQTATLLNDLAEQVGGDYASPNTTSYQRLQTLRVLAEAIGNAADNVSSGESLAVPLRASGQFSRDLIEMIPVGEEAHNLENVLIGVADNLEKRTSRRIEIVVRLLEPAML